MTADRLAEVLRLRLAHYVPGSKLPGREALARYYNVPTRVARAALALLADQGVIETTERREAVVRREPGEPQRIKRVKAVVYEAPSLYHFQQTVLLGAHRRCQGLGLAFEPVPGRPVLDHPDSLGEIVGGSMAGVGWLFLNYVPPDAALLAWRLERVPLVLVDDHSQTQPVNSVRFDVQRAIYEATSTLILLGHRRIAFVGDLRAASVIAADRRRGFLLACERYGVSVDPELMWHESQMQSESVRAVVRERLASADLPPTGLIAIDAPSGCGALAACDDLGLAVPGRVSVVAGGATPLEAAPDLARLSRFDHGPRQQLGEVAIDLLMESVRRPDPVQLMIGCTWRQAGSVGPPPR